MPGRGDGSLGISDEERKRRVVEMQRARAEEEAKRQLIAAQFKEDQEMRKERKTGGSAESSPVAPPRAQPLVQPTPAPLSSTCQIKVQMPNGESRRTEMPASATLAQVKEYVEEELRKLQMLEEFRLIVPPRIPISEEEGHLSLAAKGFCPGVSFTVQLTSSQGVVTSAPRAGEEFSAAFVSEVLAALEQEGFMPWEREQWSRVVHGQVHRGEMQRMRRTVAQVYNQGRRLPGTIKAWVERVDTALARIPSPQVATNAAVRFMREYYEFKGADREALGWRMERVPAEGAVLRLRVTAFPPASKIAKDLALLDVKEAVMEVQLGHAFP
eukprot:CAMPEP_0177727564 /NCGR_PEP_ID=MMETSP0484_2-20121128/20393_1 /TAXON_ID=354590 /ORGANISM="Rhodomonas lens, Strain RHODO" /LENGTH=326 /DNA_ID=CAMNT_0019240235 /DNA_START=84 /DNA_END=1061 /DNA_ORIENTATION=-